MITLYALSGMWFLWMKFVFFYYCVRDQFFIMHVNLFWHYENFVWTKYILNTLNRLFIGFFFYLLFHYLRKEKFFGVLVCISISYNCTKHYINRLNNQKFFFSPSKSLKVEHYRITSKDNAYSVDDESYFKTLLELVKVYVPNII